jgi:hypothetical protein
VASRALRYTNFFRNDGVIEHIWHARQRFLSALEIRGDKTSGGVLGLSGFTLSLHRSSAASPHLRAVPPKPLRYNPHPEERTVRWLR